MYLLVQLDNMLALHKNENTEVLCNLAWIETQGKSTWIFPIEDARHLQSFTHMELRLLYKNITNQEIDPVIPQSKLVAVLFKLIQRLPVSDVNLVECERQAEYVIEGDTTKWTYCRGSLRPAYQPDLYEHKSLHAPKDEQEEKDAVNKKFDSELIRPYKRRTAPAAATVTTTADPRPSRGTAKIIIWAVADKLWEAAGRPQVKEIVLKLRKEIMDVLEKEEGIKRTSASSELGAWHKVRAPY